MSYSSFEEAIQANSIPLPNKPLSHNHFSRWGKNNRYSAKLICDGFYCHDFTDEAPDIIWFPNPDKPLTDTELKKRTALLDKVKKEDEEERGKLQELAALEAKRILSVGLATGNSEYLKSKQIGAYNVSFGSHKNRPCIMIPARNITGKICSIQRIYDNGDKYFLKDGRKSGCFHTIGEIKEKEPIIFAEGYATGATVHEATGLPVVICFDAGNLEPVIKAFRQNYHCTKFVIAGDNDTYSNKNTGKLKAEEAAKKYRCTVVLPEFSESSLQHKPTDFNDLMIHEGIEVVKAQVSKALKQDKAILPAGFRMEKQGLFFQGDGEKDSAYLVCSSIEVLAYTRDENSENWGRLVRFRDLDDHTHECAIPMELLSGDCSELFRMLLNYGLRISTKNNIKNKLPELLQSIALDKRALCTTSIGWHGDHFIMPDGAIPKTDTIYLQSDNSNFIGFRCSGTLEEWIKNIAVPCRGNSRLVFSLCCAFAAPLLSLIGSESGGFNLKGSSSIGKSTALAIAASIVGSLKYIQQWKATSGAIEALAEARNHLLLCLDELGQVDGKEAGEIIYMLANESGKNRMKAKGGLRKRSEWKILFLSTGEVSIVDKLNEVNKKVQAGMLTRIVDIPADAGKGHKLFDTVHDFGDGGKLAHHLKEAVSKYYGTAIRAYLAELANIKNQLPEAYDAINKDFFLKFVNSTADPQVRRVASRFAIVVTAGQLAVKLGILPYTIEEIFECVGMCFKAWLEDRGSDTDHESEAIIRQVKAFFEANHSSRFALTQEDNEDDGAVDSGKTINQAGYKIRNAKGSYDFYVNKTTFEIEICKGLDERAVKKLLKSKGLLLGDKSGYTRSVWIRELKGRLRVIHITSAILVEG